MVDVLLFFVGTIFGSFIGTVITRLPQMISLIRPRSFCPHCNNVLGVMDLVPVLSWLWLNGRCRYCRADIGVSYICLEFISGCMVVVLYNHFGLQGIFIKSVILVYFLLVVALIDFRYQLILHNTMLYMVGGGLISLGIESWFSGVGVWLEAGIAFLVAGGIMALVFWLSRGGMGWGDVVLTAVLGLWLNLELVLLTVLLAFILGGAIGVMLLVWGRLDRKTAVPFVPFLAVAAVLSLMYGQEWIEYYKMLLY